MADIPAFAVSNLTVAIGRKTVLHDVSLTLPAGRLSALLGPNGAGKTTLLRQLAGLSPARSGTVHCQGRPLAGLSGSQRARQVAYVPQHVPAGLPLTVREFVALGRVPHLGPFSRLAGSDRQAVETAIETVELVSDAGKRLDALSGGERQRAAIARALAQEAPVLLLDEPTNHLDLRHQHRLQTLLASLCRQGKTVVEVLHDLTLAANYADHAALFADGRLVAAGAPPAVLQADTLSQVYRWPVRLHAHEGRWLVDTPAALPA
ncbi:ABC transporter ATP-binding protein [Laribacter hongkongensis]|uniref:ABC transporter ATP-binding protein n=1 Tax=Laribacter hongkongensis TaxID=168471 RepID=UPI001EFEBD1B|nr:ABC transporter ATP-binding protein [Laribacter hongkongensis]MCG8996549.1 ABC transporter ATP-binding protein [Laribacter hongkongensis]MCG9009296.1 ABC transporter ATP-binding protein [Laribacter hongkongensis]MCG9022813.1 ABC transporter ATP-binding protein [Laribacter hongkongensis]MCG9047697.1 ABC transporter ATP-binding protein [Laribacter hongkongensis]MCG9074384.1 ABC transporter ATP-binding protein [Laribacter hongkongensis]